mmetsp:Transcript_60699/g.141958  ORF Transcript_60699/g.141958 Transcript_60699/m.141958 type:complete len:271 (+) Transcript_60699:27-839(+)
MRFTHERAAHFAIAAACSSGYPLCRFFLVTMLSRRRGDTIFLLCFALRDLLLLLVASRAVSGRAGKRPLRRIEFSRSRTALAFTDIRRSWPLASRSGTAMSSSGARPRPSLVLESITPAVSSFSFRFCRRAARYARRSCRACSSSPISFKIAPTAPTDLSSFCCARSWACLWSVIFLFRALLRFDCDFCLNSTIRFWKASSDSPSSCSGALGQMSLRYVSTRVASSILATSSSPSWSRSSAVIGCLWRSRDRAFSSSCSCFAAAMHTRSS